jgi:hypothetical protein
VWRRASDTSWRGALLEHGVAVYAVDDFTEKPRPEAAAWLL